MSDNPLPSINQNPVEKDTNSFFKEADYTPKLTNWFTAKPYGFRFTPKVGEAKVMYLPIGPSNLTITTHFATHIVPTIFGTVEEHSPVRYFDINIEGTTGMGPKFVAPMSPNETPDIKTGTQKQGRTSFSIQQNLTSGFFSKTLSTIDKTYKDISAILGKSAPAKTGLQIDQTGYIAFHNLYRFFLTYKKDTSGQNKNGTVAREHDSEHPLVFFNYKDNNEYKVVIRSFTLRRDKNDPMLYFYSIVMRGYDLSEIKNYNNIQGVESQDARLTALGLNGVKNSNLLTTAKNISTQGKSILVSIANGLNQLGR